MALGPFQVADRLRAPAKVHGIAFLMRHGETAWNRIGKVMGRQPVALDENGRRQVEESLGLARALAPDLVVTSPLLRARQSAEIIAQGLGGIEVLDDSQLEEVRYGRWEGMSYHQLIEDPTYIAYRKAPLDSPMPGGESILDVQRRGVEAVTRAVSANRGRRVLFVSHGDIIRTVLCHFMGLDLTHFHRIRVDNAAFFGLEITDDFAEVKFVNLLSDPSRAFAVPLDK